MRFSFLTAIVALAAIISVSASETPSCPQEGGTLSYDTLVKCCDQNTELVSREYCYDTIKKAGRFAGRDALMSLYKRSEGEEFGEESKSRNSDGVGHKRSEGDDVGDKVIDSRFAGRDALMTLYKRSEGEEFEEESKSRHSDGVGHKRSEGDKVIGTYGGQ